MASLEDVVFIKCLEFQFREVTAWGSPPNCGGRPSSSYYYYKSLVLILVIILIDPFFLDVP